MENIREIFERCKKTDNNLYQRQKKNKIFIHLITSNELNKVKQSLWMLADPNYQFNIELKKKINQFQRTFAQIAPTREKKRGLLK